MTQALRLKSLLLVVGLLAWLSVAVPASASLRSNFAARVPEVVVLETRVGAANLPPSVFVGPSQCVAAGHVGQTCPAYDGFVVGSCVATKTAGPASLDDVLMPGGSPLGVKGTDVTIREVAGGLTDAEAMFKQLSQGGKIVQQTPTITRVELPNGGFVQIRTTMSKSPKTAATIDVNIPGYDIDKIKFNP